MAAASLACFLLLFHDTRDNIYGSLLGRKEVQKFEVVNEIKEQEEFPAKKVDPSIRLDSGPEARQVICFIAAPFF